MTSEPPDLSSEVAAELAAPPPWIHPVIDAPLVALLHKAVAEYGQASDAGDTALMAALLEQIGDMRHRLGLSPSGRREIEAAIEAGLDADRWFLDNRNDQ